MKTRVVEIIPNPDGSGLHTENQLGYADLPVPPINAPPPVPGPGERGPQPILISIDNDRFYVIGYSYDITTGAEDNPPPADYVLIVQRVPKPSQILRVGADALDKVRAMVPEPGSVN